MSKWFVNRVLPILVASDLTAIFTALYLSSGGFIDAKIKNIGQLWVPDYALVLTGIKGCPEGWSDMGQVAVEIGEHDKALYKGVTHKSRNIYDGLNILDKGAYSVPKYDLVQAGMRKAGSGHSSLQVLRTA